MSHLQQRGAGWYQPVRHDLRQQCERGSGRGEEKSNRLNPAHNHTWRLAANGGGIYQFNPAGFQVDENSFANARGTFTVDQIGNDLHVNYAAVPKPSTWWLAGVCLISRRGPVEEDLPYLRSPGGRRCFYPPR